MLLWMTARNKIQLIFYNPLLFKYIETRTSELPTLQRIYESHCINNSSSACVYKICAFFYLRQCLSVNKVMSFFNVRHMKSHYVTFCQQTIKGQILKTLLLCKFIIGRYVIRNDFHFKSLCHVDNT